jgi:hypothetical protein
MQGRLSPGRVGTTLRPRATYARAACSAGRGRPANLAVPVRSARAITAGVHAVRSQEPLDVVRREHHAAPDLERWEPPLPDQAADRVLGDAERRAASTTSNRSMRMGHLLPGPYQDNHPGVNV